MVLFNFLWKHLAAVILFLEDDNLCWVVPVLFSNPCSLHPTTSRPMSCLLRINPLQETERKMRPLLKVITSDFDPSMITSWFMILLLFQKRLHPNLNQTPMKVPVNRSLLLKLAQRKLKNSLSSLKALMPLLLKMMNQIQEILNLNLLLKLLHPLRRLKLGKKWTQS